MVAWNQQMCREMTNSKPLFVTIYAVVIVGVVFSSVFVFSAIYGSNKPTASYTSWETISSSSSPLAPVYTPNRNSTYKGMAQNSTQSATGVGGSDHSQAAPGASTSVIWEVPSSNTDMPPIEAFRLTKELVERRVKDNTVIVTFGNYAFMDFILNWVKHLTDLGVSNLLVGAMDTKILEALYWKGIPVFDMGSNMPTSDPGWGSPTFHKMGREKVTLIDALLPFGYEILMCDTDMVWLKNPLPYIARFPAADVLTSTDQVVPTVVDDSLATWEQVTGAYNIGIFHWRPTDSAKLLVKEWRERLAADEKSWDQNVFNEIVHKQLGPSVDNESGLVYSLNKTIILGLLPASIFCSGHTYFVQAMYQQLRLEPYAVHTTFQFAGTEGKRHRLREGMVFYDEPEYYNSTGGFLSFKPSIPKSLLLDGNHNVDSHFALVNYQMKQIRTALAIASLLKRTLVMPPIWCRLDRLWFPHPGVLEGTMTRQPFICPLDHVFEVNVMLKDLPEEEFGAKIDFREYSFLDNPLLPKEVKNSWLDVQLCEEGPNCKLVNGESQPGVLRFPKSRSEEELIRAFSVYKNVSVIQFSSMQDAFIGFTDKAKEKKFRNRVQRYVGIWCCVENHEPGHIYYDMYWDEKPGYKPLPPQTPADDHPPW